MLPSARVAFAILALVMTVRATYSMQLVYQFPHYLQWVENMAVRPNGNVLLTTFDDAHIYELDPKSGEDPRLVASLPDADVSIGIAEIASDVFAVAAGYLNRSDYHLGGTGRIDILDFTCLQRSSFPRVRTAASFPQAKLPNGMAALPLSPHIVLSADSITGTIYRINTETGVVDVALQDPTLAPMSNPDPFLNLLGVNGLKIHGDHLFVTSSSGQFLGRYLIGARGTPRGPLEILVEYPTPRSPDDIAIARNGTVFGAVPLTSVSKVTPDNNVSYIVNLDDEFQRPTSVALSRDERTLYVSTGGRNEEMGKGGQIFKLHLE